jgi:putative transposase
MNDILALLACLEPCITSTALRQMSQIITAMLTMTGRVTMLGISRWTERGGSYRTVQRFFYSALPWGLMLWVFFHHHLFKPDEGYVLAGDESIVTKAGKTTYGLDRFFSSLYEKAVPGLSFFALSLVSVGERRSYPMMVEQRVRSESQKAAAQAAQKTKQPRKGTPPVKRSPGRPRGSKTKDKTQADLTPELTFIQSLIRAVLGRVKGVLPLTYLVLDGHFGNNAALQMTRQCDLHLISKLRHDAKLYFPYDGPYSGRGPHRQYGDKLNLKDIPTQYLRQVSREGDIQTCIYQMTLLHHEFAQPLNVVVIRKTNLKTHAQAHVLLFSSDLALPFVRLIDYYQLRFQIEFNFRDAKQFWGLEDFMNTTPTAVTNAANLALFMVNVAHLLLVWFRQLHPNAGVLDLKAHFRGRRYVSETLKLLPEMPEPILVAQVFDTVAQLGSIYPVEPCFNSS